MDSFQQPRRNSQQGENNMQKKDPFAPAPGFVGPYGNPAGLSRPHGFGNVPTKSTGSPAPATPFYPQANALLSEQAQSNLRGGTSMRSSTKQSYQQPQQQQLPVPPQRQFGKPVAPNPFAPPRGFERQTTVNPPQTFAKDYVGQSNADSFHQSQVNYIQQELRQQQQHQQQHQQQQFMQQQQQRPQQQYAPQPQPQPQQQQRPQQQFAPQHQQQPQQQPSQQQSQQLPNGKTRFHLLIYDLSRGVMAQTSMTILGAKIEAVYHCGIECFGLEYWYGPGGIQATPAHSFGPQNDMRPLEIIPCETSKQKSEFQAWLRSKQGVYGTINYNLAKNNCNNFANAAIGFLTNGMKVPKYVMGLPMKIAMAPRAGALMPLVEAITKAMKEGKKIDSAFLQSMPRSEALIPMINAIQKSLGQQADAMKSGTLLMVNPFNDEQPNVQGGTTTQTVNAPEIVFHATYSYGATPVASNQQPMQNQPQPQQQQSPPPQQSMQNRPPTYVNQQPVKNQYSHPVKQQYNHQPNRQMGSSNNAGTTTSNNGITAKVYTGTSNRMRAAYQGGPTSNIVSAYA